MASSAEPTRVVGKNLLIVFSVTLIAVMGVASITPVIPRVAAVFGVSAQRIGLLITAYTLPGIALMPVSGMLADRFGRKPVLLPSLLLFALAGAACALTASFAVLLGLRFLEGIGAAAVSSMYPTLIGDLYTAGARTKAMGYNASVLSIGTASYPAIGGALALFGWRFPFLLPLLALPVGFLVLFGLAAPTNLSRQPLLSYLRGAWQGMRSVGVLALLVCTGMTFVLLYGGYLTYFPILLDSAFHVSPLIIGLVLASSSATTALVSSQLLHLTGRFSGWGLLRAAFILYAAAFAVVPLVTHVWMLFGATVLFGAAQGINIPTVQNLLSELAPDAYRAVFMAANGTVLRLGQPGGPVLMGVVAGVWGLETVFYSAIVLALATFVLLSVLLARREGAQ